MKKLTLAAIIALTTSTAFASDYQVQYTNDCYQGRAPVAQRLQPVTVHTGRTVTVQDHYDVYQPRVVYDKVDSYTTTQVCKYCD